MNSIVDQALNRAGYVLCLLTHQMHHHPASMPVIAVLKDINALPCAQSKATLVKRDRKLGLCQGRFDMRRHIIGSFGAMTVRAIAGRDAAEEVLQITTNIGVGIFLDS